MGHVMRIVPAIIVKTAVNGTPPHGNRRPGRPRTAANSKARFQTRRIQLRASSRDGSWSYNLEGATALCVKSTG